jgi:hypothetical protein
MAFTYYEELEGSPTIEGGRKGVTATRIVRIAWEDINAFMFEIFPDPFFGYQGNSFFPGFEWLRASKAKIEPFQPNSPSGMNEVMNVYPGGAKVTVTYTNPAEDQGMQGGAAGDHSGPGKNAGSSGGHDGEDNQFLTHKVSVGGQFLTWPKKNLQWQLSASTGAAWTPGAPYKDFEVGPETLNQVVVVQLEHTISWSFVLWPPWTAIRQCIGTVNEVAIAGCPPECALFTGVEASQKITNTGGKAWTLDYKFSEKNENASDPLNPQGWNFFLRPDGVAPGTWQRIIRRMAPGFGDTVEIPTSFGMYIQVDHSFLFVPDQPF